VSRLRGIPEEHRLKFAVARASLFHLTELSERRAAGVQQRSVLARGRA
jgi:hypothetical protein